MAGLTALVASLASGVEGTAVGGGAVAGDVAELAAGVALHGLSLAITGKVVGATALVAGGGTRAAGEAATGEAAVTATAHGGTTAHGTRADRVGAGTLEHVSTQEYGVCSRGAEAQTYSKMAGLAAVVAAAAGGVAGEAQSRAVGLDVAKTLAVVALLGLGGARKRAAVGLVAGLLAVVAETLRGGADLGVVADVATLVASTTRERRHGDLGTLVAEGHDRGKTSVLLLPSLLFVV